MSELLDFLRNLFVRTPQEILVALLRLIFIFILVLFVILLRLWEWLLEFLKRKNLYPEEKKEPCGRLPEAIIRRPDPCIYSQRLLQSQGLPVTWNNPDIWVARADNPGNIELDSYHLIEDTDYIVSVRVHNASTDPAIGVRVRLNYRPWSFNSPDLVPLETDAIGNEVFRFVDVAPMSSKIAQFNWHTPPLEPNQEKRHFCIQASLFHPMDINTSNNMGQENTNVYKSPNPGYVQPGQEIVIEVPLFNYAREVQNFRFEATVYEVNIEDKFELQLKTTRGYARWSASQRLANFLPSLHVKQVGSTSAESVKSGGRRFNFQTQPRLAAAKNKYVGFEKIKEMILSRDYSLPAGMTVTAHDEELDKGVEIPAKETKIILLSIKVPNDSKPGSILTLNIIARSADGVLAGGITLIINIKEDN